jgi:hypothetical protein
VEFRALGGKIPHLLVFPPLEEAFKFLPQILLLGRILDLILSETLGSETRLHYFRLSSDFGLTTVKTVCDEHPHPTLTSMDDKWFCVSWCGTGEFRRLQRLPERLTLDSVLRIDGVARKAPHPPQPEVGINGGPQMI